MTPVVMPTAKAPRHHGMRKLKGKYQITAMLPIQVHLWVSTNAQGYSYDIILNVRIRNYFEEFLEENARLAPPLRQSNDNMFDDDDDDDDVLDAKQEKEQNTSEPQPCQCHECKNPTVSLQSSNLLKTSFSSSNPTSTAVSFTSISVTPRTTIYPIISCHINGLCA